MYTVLVAEDEPVSLKAVCSIIEKYCDDYVITATAENGEKALALIREKQPDLVISDIKMPKITGVELARIVREEMPDTCFIIVSGYQDFEYTQSAIRSGVTDYLLKPVMPDAIRKSMAYASERLKLIHYRARNRLLGQMGRNEAVDEKELNKYFPHERYYGALIRTNGLPRRFNIDRNREIYSDIDEQYFVFGRDEMESLYLIPSGFIQGKELVSYVEKAQGSHILGGYHTLIYEEKSFDTASIQEKVRLLYRELDLKSTVGHTCVICLKEDNGDGLPGDGGDSVKSDEILKKIDVYAVNNNADSLKTEIREAFREWGTEKRPQLWMEGFARNVISILRRHGLLSIPENECEYMLGDIFSNADNIDTLSSSLIDIFLFDEGCECNRKAGSKEYFEKIVRFLELHIEEPLSLQDVCESFAISQAYLSKLFRKYTSHSFNKYFTGMKMNRAKELFSEDPGRYIKEVARMVGYEDQFYFSRIFRTYAGKSPTEYIRDCRISPEKGKKDED